MKKIITLFILVLTGISFGFAENQRYAVSNKDGKARFVPVERADDNWKWVEPRVDIYLENGVEVEGFEINPDESLNYKGTPYVCRRSFIIEYEGKYYVSPFPEKDLSPIDENGEITTGLGIRNYLSNTFLGDFYKTKIPGLIALLCSLISGIFVIISIFKDNVPVFVRWAFAMPLCIVSLLEIGAAFSLGTDAAWWVNPDDVGYWVATPLLIPYSLVAALMVFSYKLYGFVGKVDGLANIIISVMLIIGIVLTVISAIFVVVNFVFAVCMLIGAGYLFQGVTYKTAGGDTIVRNITGSAYRTDRYGKTTRIE